MRLINLIIIFFITFNATINCSNYPKDIEKILKRDKLIVGLYYRDIFPFYFHNKNGDLIGYDIDIAKDLAKNLGVQVVFNRDAKTFDEIIDFVSKGKVDIAISLISITYNRAKKVLFSKPYLNIHPVIVLNRLKASNFKYTEGKRVPGTIGEKKGTSYIDFSKVIFKSPNIKEFETWDNAIKELLEGKIFAILRDEVGVSNLFMKNPSLSIKLRTIILKNFNDNIAIAINPQFWHLHYWINLFLDEYNNEKSVDKIILKYKKLKEIKK